VFDCAEINSSFHRPHASSTYAKWAMSTPAEFRFAVKMPRLITHDQQLRRARVPLERFLEQTAGLGNKRGPLLLQLPPSLGFEARVAGRMLDLLRAEYDGIVVCEPRHETWFSAAAEALLIRFRIARAAADPPPTAGADSPGGWGGLVYYRLHGSPRKYWSKYDAPRINAFAQAISGVATSADVWCVFDNTASGGALENAWEVQRLVDIGRTAAPAPTRHLSR
jgi:uncharacterized protein YecE (DUF72 family)